MAVVKDRIETFDALQGIVLLGQHRCDTEKKKGQDKY
jgi:hypothetical protein